MRSWVKEMRRDIVGDALLAELQPELGRRVVEGLDRLERHHESLRHAAEGELHLETLIRHLQVPELVLQDDGHLVRILFLEALRDHNPLCSGIEGDVEMVLAGKAAPLHEREDLADHPAQSLLGEEIVSDVVFRHVPVAYSRSEAEPPCIKWRASVARCPPKPRLAPAKRLGLDV